MLASRHNIVQASLCSRFDINELEGSIVARFQRVVLRNPAHVAICYQGTLTTYGELDAQSSALAHALLASLRVGQEPVALMYKHGPAHHVAQLGVLKAAKFYSNLDSDLLLERQVQILANLGARHVLHDSACASKARELVQRFPAITFVNTETIELCAFQTSLPPLTITAGDYASIVYTSGSTGPPQGVILTHQNILHLAHSHGHAIGLSRADRATQICPLWTAASASEIYCALLNEATLFPCSLQTEGVIYCCRLLEEAAITTMVAAPASFRMLMQAARQGQKFAAMRVIRLGGDQVTRRDVALLHAHFNEHCHLRVVYGTSEFIPIAQFCIDQHQEAAEERIPVGYAVEGCEIAILDEQGKVLGANALGEIAVSSPYLSPGYWKNQALTAERFPLRQMERVAMRTYLTRDLGYIDARGCLYHLGRNDARVKIHGKMVLVSDVEKALSAVNGVKDAIVIACNSDGATGTELAGFVVRESVVLDEIAIRNQLRSTLAPEIIPRKLVFLNELPLLRNNKIDRMKLKGLLAEVKP